MAQFRLEIKIHKRGANGSGIMQKAGYNSRQTLYDDEVGLKTKLPAKSKVEELCYQKIFLPKGADEKFLNRTTLWNEVQKVEHQKGAQMAREFVGNLPLTHMLPLEQSVKILEEFAQYLATQGMICDVALHYNKTNINFHILCPMRKLKPNGKKFAPKRVNAYVCKDSTGNTKYFHKVGDIAKYNEEHNSDFGRVPLLDKNGNQKMRTRKGRKPTPEWERRPIDLTGWNDAVDQKSFFKKCKSHDTNVEKWRQKLCEIGNKYLTEQEKWEHKSYKRQGINRIPTIHEGARVQYLEQKEQKRVRAWNDAHPENKQTYSPVTTLRKQNNTIRKANALLSRINHKINQYQKLLSHKLSKLFSSLNASSKDIDRSKYAHIQKENERRIKYLTLKEKSKNEQVKFKHKHHNRAYHQPKSSHQSYSSTQKTNHSRYAR